MGGLIIAAKFIVGLCVGLFIGYVTEKYMESESGVNKCHCGWDADGRTWGFCGQCGKKRGEHMQIKSHC